jgi:hypothetical protein
VFPVRYETHKFVYWDVRTSYIYIYIYNIKDIPETRRGGLSGL